MPRGCAGRAATISLLLVSSLGATLAWAQHGVRPGPPAPGTDGPRNEFRGVLAPVKTALIKSKFDERVAEIEIQAGSPVRAGQLLLRFVDDEYRVERDRAALLLEQARADYERAQELHRQQTISQQQFEKVETSRRLAEADLALAEIRLKERSIVAPFDGVLAERFVDPGASVEAGQPLLRVTAVTPLRVEALLPEEMLARVKAAPRVMVRLAAPDTTLVLSVRQAPRLVDPSSGMFQLMLDVDNRSGRLIPGVSCRIRIPER